MVVLHIESKSQAGIEITHEYFCEVTQKGALSYHSIIVLIKDFEKALTYNAGKVAIGDKGYSIYFLLFYGIWCQAS